MTRGFKVAVLILAALGVALTAGGWIWGEVGTAYFDSFVCFIGGIALLVIAAAVTLLTWLLD